MSRWKVTPIRDAEWHVLFRRSPASAATHVATIDWAVRLDRPAVARTRLEEGLNGVHGDFQPPRSWRLAGPGTPTAHGLAWILTHNGVDCASIVWHHPPTSPTHVWQARVLAGLNRVPASRHDAPPPAPLPRTQERTA